MSKRITLLLASIVIIALAVTAWFVQAQFGGLQIQVSELEAENSDLQDQIMNLQNQTTALGSQNGKLVNQLGDLTKQLALERSLRIRILSVSPRAYWNSYGGLLVSYPFNVTVRNNDVITVSGLTLTVNTFSGLQQIGWTSVSDVNVLRAGEERVIQGEAVVPLNHPSNLTYVATLNSGNVVLDEFTLP